MKRAVILTLAICAAPAVAVAAESDDPTGNTPYAVDLESDQYPTPEPTEPTTTLESDRPSTTLESDQYQTTTTLESDQYTTTTVESGPTTTLESDQYTDVEVIAPDGPGAVITPAARTVTTPLATTPPVDVGPLIEPAIP